ncbi:MAG: VWA domain-containing protein, partial [Pseudomonadota bacterium]
MNLHLRQSETSTAVESPLAALLPGVDAAPTDAPHLELATQWQDARLAIALITLEQRGVRALRLKGRHGPARDVWLAELAQSAAETGLSILRITSAAPTSQLLSGLDLAATLDAGRPVHTPGMIERASGGILIVSGAERLSPEASAILAQAIDDQDVRVVALDEALEDEDAQIPAALATRLPVTVKTDGIPLAICDQAKVQNVASVGTASISLELQTALAQALETIGEPSTRTLLACCEVTKALAMMKGDPKANSAHAHHALQLVLGVTLTPPQQENDEHEAETPEPEAELEPQPERNTQQNEQPYDATDSADASGEDMTVETEHGATLDPGLLMAMASQLAERKSNRSPKGSTGAGAKRKKTRRGRPAGHSENPPYPDARPDILATLRTAAPWQKVRAKTAPDHMADRVLIRSSDFRYKRLHQTRETVTIFIVDASGSTATQRLGEAKGAIERLLADCYVRRDNVALVAFRGRQAEILLEPTRSLVRAKRGLSSLP